MYFIWLKLKRCFFRCRYAVKYPQFAFGGAERIKVKLRELQALYADSFYEYQHGIIDDMLQAGEDELTLEYIIDFIGDNDLSVTPAARELIIKSAKLMNMMKNDRVIDCLSDS